jgi:hypothetical protein
LSIASVGISSSGDKDSNYLRRQSTIDRNGQNAIQLIPFKCIALKKILNGKLVIGKDSFF